MASWDKRSKGFSLIELIIAIAILVILTGLLAPQFMKYLEKARQAKIIQKLDTIYDVMSAAYIDALEQGEDKNDMGGDTVIIMDGKANSSAALDNALAAGMKETLGDEESKKVTLMIYRYMDFAGGSGTKTISDPYSLANVSIKYKEDGHTYYYDKGIFFNEKSGSYGELLPGVGNYNKWK